MEKRTAFLPAEITKTKKSRILCSAFHVQRVNRVQKDSNALPREELGRAAPYNRGTSSIFKFESFTESSLGYYKRDPNSLD